jgi:hypothetical protein
MRIRLDGVITLNARQAFLEYPEIFLYLPVIQDEQWRPMPLNQFKELVFHFISLYSL